LMERGIPNINGPSLIRVPSWVQNPLGKYYLYFAHHIGTFIRLLFADSLMGPWKLFHQGVLHMSSIPEISNTSSHTFRFLKEKHIDHIASPDVVIDDTSQTIRMYFH